MRTEKTKSHIGIEFLLSLTKPKIKEAFETLRKPGFWGRFTVYNTLLRTPGEALAELSAEPSAWASWGNRALPGAPQGITEDDARRHFIRFWNRLAIDKDTHLFLLYSVGIQPNDRKYHFHLTLSPEVKSSLEPSKLVELWEKNQGSGSAWIEPYDRSRGGIPYQLDTRRGHHSYDAWTSHPHQKPCRNRRCAFGK